MVGWYEGEARVTRSVIGAAGRLGRSRPGRAVMRVLGSITNRIFLASALLAMLSIGAAVYFVSARHDRARPKPSCSAI